MAVTSENELRSARLRMVEQQVAGRGIAAPRVLEAMQSVERHRFVSEASLPRAYGPYTLPIGEGQTMPHPYTVGLMAGALQLRGGERVLEIGSGSGYQTAILAHLAAEVWSLERLPKLALLAERRLIDLGCDNVRVLLRSGLGLPEQAPFDAIHVSAAAPEVPGLLLSQLAPGGRMIAPIGRGAHQRLLLLVRRGRVVTTRSLGACRFQPLLGALEPAWTEPS